MTFPSIDVDTNQPATPPMPSTSRRVLLSASGLLALTHLNLMAQPIPQEVTDFVDAIKSIKGISDASIRKTELTGLSMSDLSLPGPHADLPLAALRRSGGSTKPEVLISLDFRIDRNDAGLKAVEFISWWVRDQSRGGENIQIRSIGLPPQAGTIRQLGKTLRFSIDWFYVDTSRDIKALLAAMGKKANELKLAIAIYKPND